MINISFRLQHTNIDVGVSIVDSYRADIYEYLFILDAVDASKCGDAMDACSCS